MVCLFTVAMFFTLVPGKHRLDDLEFDHAIIRDLDVCTRPLLFGACSSYPLIIYII